MSDGEQTKSIRVPVLTRVEGEGALDLDIADGVIRDLKLRIYEPPRLFEKFLEGRDYAEIPDIVARICGICPVAYQMSAVRAIEQAFAVEPDEWVRDMREVFYCGEWIQSHALHIHMLAAPDFLGFENITQMAAIYPQEVRRGLRLQGLGNRLIELFGGRSVHPVGARVGGFYRAPDARAVAKLLAALREGETDARELLRWTTQLSVGGDEQDFTSVCLDAEADYPFMGDRLISSQGLVLDIHDFQQQFQETQVAYSTALHSLHNGRAYLLGPLARVNRHHALLHEPVRDGLARAGITFPSRNMFHSIIARAAEIYHALLQAIQLLQHYRVPTESWVPVTPRAGIGYGCSEAPRGVLWHRYEFDADGKVLSANIVPPTSQNQARIEEDLRAGLYAYGLDRDADEIRSHAEKIIRNYDPCISCATHFLKLKVTRR